MQIGLRIIKESFGKSHNNNNNNNNDARSKITTGKKQSPHVLYKH